MGQRPEVACPLLLRSHRHPGAGLAVPRLCSHLRHQLRAPHVGQCAGDPFVTVCYDSNPTASLFMSSPPLIVTVQLIRYVGCCCGASLAHGCHHTDRLLRSPPMPRHRCDK